MKLYVYLKTAPPQDAPLKGKEGGSLPMVPGTSYILTDEEFGKLPDAVKSFMRPVHTYPKGITKAMAQGKEPMPRPKKSEESKPGEESKPETENSNGDEDAVPGESSERPNKKTQPKSTRKGKSS